MRCSVVTSLLMCVCLLYAFEARAELDLSLPHNPGMVTEKATGPITSVYLLKPLVVANEIELTPPRTIRNRDDHRRAIREHQRHKRGVSVMIDSLYRIRVQMGLASFDRDLKQLREAILTPAITIQFQL